MEIGVSGHYSFYKNGELIGNTSNMILDGYFTRFFAGQTSFYPHIECGSGSTAVTAADTGLETPIAASRACLGVSGDPTVESPGGDLQIRHTWAYTYAAGTFTGTVAEVGLRIHTSGTAPVDGFTDSRALVRDVNGNTSTISITSEDSLTIVFVFLRTFSGKPASSGLSIGGVKTKVSVEWLDVADTNAGFGAREGLARANLFGAGAGQASATQEIVDNPWSVSATDLGGSTANTHTIASGSDWLEETISWTMPAAAMIAGVKYIRFSSNGNRGVHFDPPVTDSGIRTITIILRYHFSNGESQAGGYSGVALSASILPATITEIDIPVGAFTTRGAASATPENGTAPFTYSWALQSAAGTPALSADSPTSRTTTFSATGASLDSSSETWRCTITDANGEVATADTVVSLTWAA